MIDVRGSSRSGRSAIRAVVVVLLMAMATVAMPSTAGAASVFVLGVTPLEPAIAGSTVDLAFDVTNDGPDPASSMVGTFTLPAGMTYLADDGNCTDAGAVVTCNLFVFTAMDPGQSARVVVTVAIDASYVVDNGGGDPVAAAPMGIAVAYTGGSQSGSRDVPVGERADLRIQKVADDTSPNAGQAFDYAIVVDNLGPSVARNVTISDTLFRSIGPDMTSSTLTISGCSFSTSQGGGLITQFTCSTGPALHTQFGADIGTMGTDALDPLGVYPDGLGGTFVGGRLRANFRMTALEQLEITNEARVLSDTFDPDTSDNLATATVVTTAVADLSLVKVADVATASPGEEITYTLTATNDGPSNAVNVVVRDVLPANVELVSATTPGGVCLAGTPGDLNDPVMCYLGTVPRPNSTDVDPPPNFEVITITVRVAADAPVPGSVVNRAWVSSALLDLDNSDDASQATTEVIESDHLFTPVTPSRQFDTRDGTGGVPVGKVAPGVPLAFTVTGANGVPVGAAAVSLNVTAEGPDADGHLTVYPCAGPVPHASNLNFLAGQTVANAVVAPVDAAGQVCFVSNVATNVISDVSGWFAAGQGMTTLDPVRIFDTRNGTGGVPVGKVAGGTTLTFEVAGTNGLPATGVAAVALNVTVTGADEGGHATVFPCGPRPVASNLNYMAGQTVPNMVIAPVDPQGRVCFYVSGTTDLLADMSAWFDAGSEMHPLNPSRVFDTRSGLGGVPAAPLTAGVALEVPVTGRFGVPTSGAGAVVLNATATRAVLDGHLTVFPCGDRPLTSNVNLRPGVTVANAVIAPVSPQGSVCFYVNTATDLVVDIDGWFEGPTV